LEYFLSQEALVVEGFLAGNGLLEGFELVFGLGVLGGFSLAVGVEL
jgi:hypothetical protein